MGSSVSTPLGDKSETKLHEDELNEEIEYICVICVPMKGRNWQIAGKIFLTLTFIGGF